jgi:sugar fermentation stimulation protein A
MRGTPGSYILFLSLPKQKKIAVGKLGVIHFPAGLYTYVGSALGGWESRINRHFVGGARVHWHIDYLRAEAQVRGAIVFESSERLECTINKMLTNVSHVVVPGFGSSDCGCSSHLHLMKTDRSD